VAVPRVVEASAQQLDEARRDSAHVTAACDTFFLLQLANDRQVHE